MEESKRKISFKEIWSIFMAIVYFGLAYLVVFTSFPYNSAYEDQGEQASSVKIIRVMLGITLFMYGLFRAFRVYKSMK